MRIALVHSFYSSNIPSGENAVVEMQVAALSSAGHEVLLVAAHTDELRLRRFYTLKTAINVVTGSGMDPFQAINDFQPDVVHVHNLFPNFATAWLSKWDGPLVATIHNYRPLCAAGTLSRNGSECSLCPVKGQHNAVLHRCYRGSALATLPLAIRNHRGVSHDAILRRADAQIFLSSRSLDVYRSFGLDVSSKQKVIPNFVEDPMDVVSTSRAPYWMFVGRLSREKGILELVQNWPSNVELLVFGDGPVAHEARDRSNGSVRFMGVKPRRTVLEALGMAQGLVIPSLWAEGLPTVYLEALSAGCPVVTLIGNSVADDLLLTPGAGSVLNDLSGVGEILRDISQNHDHYSRQARLHFLANFDRKVWLESTERLYSDLVSSGRYSS